MMNDPWIRRHRRTQALAIICMVFLGILLLFAIGLMFIPVFDVSWHAISIVLNFGVVFVLFMPALVLDRRALKHRLRQHLKLFAGDPSVLMQKQPAPNRYALLPPLTIALQRKGTIIVFLCGLLAFIALILAGAALWLLIAFFTATYDTGVYLLLAVLAGVMAFIFGLLLWLVFSMSRFWVKITEEGLEAQFRGRNVRIAWSEARFFCVDGIMGLEKLRTYTLAGEKQSVSWIQMMSENGVELYRAAHPFELYQQQSQALLEVIAGQTGLPLYDMRLPNEVRSLFSGRSYSGTKKPSQTHQAKTNSRA